jgi:hypothetical protein
MDVQSLEKSHSGSDVDRKRLGTLPLSVPCLRRTRCVFEKIRSRKFGVFHQTQHMHPHLQP